MTYTILSATWGNEEKTSAVVITEEVAAVAISEIDTPEEWDAFLTWAKKNQVTELDLTPIVREKSEVTILKERIAELELKYTDLATKVPGASRLE